MVSFAHNVPHRQINGLRLTLAVEFGELSKKNAFWFINTIHTHPEVCFLSSFYSLFVLVHNDNNFIHISIFSTTAFIVSYIIYILMYKLYIYRNEGIRISPRALISSSCFHNHQRLY